MVYYSTYLSTPVTHLSGTGKLADLAWKTYHLHARGIPN